MTDWTYKKVGGMLRGADKEALPQWKILCGRSPMKWMILTLFWWLSSRRLSEYQARRSSRLALYM